MKDRAEEDGQKVMRSDAWENVALGSGRERTNGDLSCKAVQMGKLEDKKRENAIYVRFHNGDAIMLLKWADIHTRSGVLQNGKSCQLQKE